MMSTTGRMPVMAAPTPIPVIPASEIGESITRSGPNSSTSPLSTLKGVPASATSSPMMKTDWSRRSSSASASLTASPKVSSRTSPASTSVCSTLGVDMLIDLAGIREVGGERELDAGLHVGRRLLGQTRKLVRGRCAHIDQPGAEPCDRVALRLPGVLLLPGPVRPIDVADVMTRVAVGVAEQEARTPAAARALDRPGRPFEDGSYVLAVHLLGGD